jgi:hypothetical protein
VNLAVFFSSCDCVSCCIVVFIELQLIDFDESPNDSPT